MNMNGSRQWRSGLAAPLLVLAFLVTGGCGDSGNGGGGPAPAPTITSFTAAKSPVTAGTGTTVTAVFTGGTGVVSNGVGAVTSGVPASTGNLGTSTTFLLTVTNSAGATATWTLFVNVVPAPEISDFNASENPVTTGRSTTLSYSFTGGTGSIDQNIGSVTSGGTRAVQPTTTTIYTLTVTNAAGTAVTRTITVGVAGAPRIISFTANPTTVAPGETATLTAVFENGVGSVDQGIGTIASGVGMSTGAMATTATYRLTVTNAALESVSADVTVAVTRFQATGSLTVPRSRHTATLLQDGRVLVAGGDELGTAAEIYDPATGAFVTTGSMGVARRWGHAAARLADGRVLVSGGGSPKPSPEASAELYDPATGSFTPTGAMLHGRTGHTATTLPDGKVLIVGGCCTIMADSHYVDDEIYDPMTGTFSAASPRVPRSSVYYHAAIRLSNGEVLIAYGYQVQNGADPNWASVFAPVSGLFRQVGSMQHRRYLPRAALLDDGRVLVVGQQGTGGDYNQRDLDLYDPVTETFALTAKSQLFDALTATTLPDGTVLVTGNVSADESAAADSAERYDPGTDTFKAEGLMRFPKKDGYTATRLLTGEVLFVGGTADGVTATSSSELFR